MNISAKITGSIADQRKFLQDLARELESTIPFGMASNQMALISNRVQNQGRLTSGALIGGGNYSPAYAKYRQKRGRQTAFIDLTLDGGMMTTGFTVVMEGNGTAALGFVNAHEYAKYEANTKRYGEFIQPSEAEIQLSIKDFVNPATEDAIRKAGK